MEHGALIPNLFRTEYRKIVAVLCKRFGFDQIETAEDIASDTFLTAAQTWGRDGVPANPTAWLYHVAKNKAKNYLQRAVAFETRIAPELRQGTNGIVETEIDLSPENINDSQLRMMFAICHPSLSAAAQIGLSLRILCGFGIEEIADAFLTSKETIQKRLYRAKEKLRQEKVELVFPKEADIEARLATVLTTMYLLFNEGYYSISQNMTLRKDLCLEAMRLCHMLTEYHNTNTPQVNALLALMYFHASRFEARTGRDGEIVLYADQDRSLWNSDLIFKGEYFLRCASNGTHLSKYHLEAGIAWWHTRKSDTPEKWENILQLYNRLLQVVYSPVAALNRTYAFSRVYGKEAAIAEAEKLGITDNQFYFALLGELYTDVDNPKASQYFEQALSMARTEADRKVMQRKIEEVRE